MTIDKKIKDWIKETLGVEEDFSVVHSPSNFSLGDYSTNIAFQFSKKQSKNPNELAKLYKEKLSENIISDLEKIEVAGGYINFFLTRKCIREILEKIKIGKDLPNGLKGKKIFIEHTQPNPFKEFHIGHLMNNAIGESLNRIIQTNGAEVETCSYHGDKGVHVAKAVWAILNKKTDNFSKAYAIGNLAYENLIEKVEIDQINKKIYEENDEYINLIYKEGKKQSLDNFEKIYKRLDSYFNHHFFESQSGEIGKKIVEENIGKVFEKGENGAVIFKGENFYPKTHIRVFLNSDGLPTYEAKEVGLAKIKKEIFDYDESITITANEQDSFFDVVEVAIGEVFPDRKGKLHHLSHGMLKLPDGKMSSRTGNVITAVWLIDEVKKNVLDKMVDRDFEENKKNEIAEIVAIGAIKYSILKQSIGKDIIFDFNKSLSFEGDSGPYLQYSAVRANSVLKKAGEIGLKSDSKIPENWQTKNLERLLSKFYSVIERSCADFSPQYICTYLIELAGEFNSFYAKEKIVDEKDTNSQYKIFITEVFKETMQSGLWLLGIKTPEEM